MAHGATGRGDGDTVGRRSFLGTLSLALGGVLGLCGAAVAAIFSVTPALRRRADSDPGACPAVPGASRGGSSGPRLETITVMVSSGWAKAYERHAVFVDEAPDGALRVFSSRCP